MPILPLLIVLLLTAAVSAQPMNAMPDFPTITVTGEATVAVKPDRAVIGLGAVAQADDAAAAQQRVNEIMHQAIDAIRQVGVPEDRIQTAGLSLQPVYSQPGRGHVQGGESHVPTIVGYRASNTVRVQLDDLELIGKVIDAGITAGANQLEGINFEIKDDTQSRSQALEQATANARSKADVIARAAGTPVSVLHNITEGGVHIVSPVYRGARALAAMEMDTPVQPGEVQIRASVTVTYRVNVDGPNP